MFWLLIVDSCLDHAMTSCPSEVVSQLTLCLLRQVEEVRRVRRGQEAGWKRAVALIVGAGLLSGYHIHYLVGFILVICNTERRILACTSFTFVGI